VTLLHGTEDDVIPVHVVHQIEKKLQSKRLKKVVFEGDHYFASKSALKICEKEYTTMIDVILNGLPPEMRVLIVVDDES